MGAPVPGMTAAADETAGTLLDSLRTISATERRKHASVLNYWLSIRGDRQFPAIRDLDPLEISDAGPFSLLLEMMGGGEDATVRHLGDAIAAGVEAETISDAPYPSLLTCIGNKLPVVASSRQAFAFEDEFATADGTTRCWVTLLPFSAKGNWIDYVYGFVSLDPSPEGAAAMAPEISAVEAVPEPETELPEAAAEAQLAEEFDEADFEQVPEIASEAEEQAEGEEQAGDEMPAGAADEARAGFSARLFDRLQGVSGFYGRVAEFHPTSATLSITPSGRSEAEAAHAAEESAQVVEGPLLDKLTEVRSKADEARAAKLRSNRALYEGLSAAYDFALDAEDNAEEYLRLVEAQGLKIQLRSPMKPVVKLAFDGMCDDATIAQLEAVLAWALKQDLPRGSLAERIEAEGGLQPILSGMAGAG